MEPTGFYIWEKKSQQGVKEFNNLLHFEEERGKPKFIVKALLVASGIQYIRMEVFK